MIFCMNMYLDNCTNTIEYEGHRSKVKVIFCYWSKVYQIVFIKLGKIVVENAP